MILWISLAREIRLMETQSIKPSNVPAEVKPDLAILNIVLAAERTMMSILRTSLSFISFGFTIYTFLHYVREGEKLPVRESGPKVMGLALIGIGLFILITGSWQHREFLKQFRTEATQKLPWSVSLAGAAILGAVGFFALITLITRTWWLH